MLYYKICLFKPAIFNIFILTMDQITQTKVKWDKLTLYRLSTSPQFCRAF